MTLKQGCIVLIILAHSLALEIAYEKMEQISGFDVLESSLRVRKYNRTTMVLNGTLNIKIEMDNTFVTKMDLFHSRLGNQQFNHYPMKLPTEGLCKFIDNVHDFYPETVKYFINYPPKGECPVKPRAVHVFDNVFPAENIPSMFPQGLWKAVAITSTDTVERTNFELTVKVYKDHFL